MTDFSCDGIGPNAATLLLEAQADQLPIFTLMAAGLPLSREHVGYGGKPAVIRPPTLEPEGSTQVYGLAVAPLVQSRQPLAVGAIADARRHIEVARQRI